MSRPVLYHYWRSSASYRVRIALNLLGVDCDYVAIDLMADEHRAPAYLARNPQGLVPVLEIDGLMMSQSLAIAEYLHETRAGSTLLPADAAGRQHARALAYAVAMEIHPVTNLEVANHAMAISNGDDAARKAWMQKFNGERLEKLETLLRHGPQFEFCHGDQPGLADLCLVPQVYNAERWDVDMSGMPLISQKVAACRALPAFAAAHPDRFKPA